MPNTSPGRVRATDPRIAYTIAFPFVVATISMIYQRLRDGKWPQGWRDLYAPRTGGTVPYGQEHALMPGYQEDVLGWTTHPMQEACNKLGGLPQTVYEQITNKDWKNQPIANTNAPLIDQSMQRMAHIFGKFGPISI